jgi:hypothetical protein
MHRKISITLVVLAILLAVLWGGAALAVDDSSMGKNTELNYWDKDKAFNGYTLFTPLQQNEENFWTYIIDMEGNICHSFTNKYMLRNHAELLENGHFLRLGFDRAVQDAITDLGGLQTKGGASTILQELNWDGSVFWEFQYMTKNAGFHHDFRRIWNKKLQQYTFIVATWERRTPADTLAKYGAKATADWSPDSVVEVNYNKEIVWKWSVFDHLVQETGPTKPGYGIVKDTPQKLDIAWKALGADWNHTNSLDYNEARDEIVFNIGGDEFVVIDHGKTFVSTTNWAANFAAAAGKDGDFLYRFGSPAKYGQGAYAAAYTTAPVSGSNKDQQLFFYHAIQWIRPYHWNPPRAATDDWVAPGPDMALPGAGNFLVFDNGTGNPMYKKSAILEINPFLNASKANTGSYVWPHLAGNTLSNPLGYPAAAKGSSIQFNLNNQVTWYFSDDPITFNSTYISGVQRLPNGNTLITSGADGHFFEVTKDGTLVWEYLNPKGSKIVPFRTRAIDATMTKEVFSRTGFDTFRVYRYAATYPGLKGKDLSPKGTITGRVPGTINQTAPPPVPITGFGFGTGVTTSGAGGSAGNTGGGAGAGGY